MLEESIILMVLKESVSKSNTHASETAEAQQLTQEYAAQSKSTVFNPPLNGDCFPTIVEKIEEKLSCKDLTVVERVQTKRLRIVDRVRQNKFRVLEKKFMEQASVVEQEPNLETRAFLYGELERTRIHCESVINEHCAKMSIQGKVMSEDELQAYADMRGASVKVYVLIFMLILGLFFLLLSVSP
jgi:hypothetical protein